MLCITQNIGIDGLEDKIERLCEKKVVEEGKAKEIVAQTEQRYSQNASFMAKNLDLDFDIQENDDNEDALLDFFGIDEDEDEDEDEDDDHHHP